MQLTNQFVNDEFSSIFEFASIGMALIGPDGTWLKVNRSLTDMLGYSQEELLKITFQDITHPDDLNIDLAYLEKLSNGEISTYQMNKRYFKKSGEIFWINLSVSKILNPDNTIKYYISQIENINENKISQLNELKEKQRLDNILSATNIATWEWNVSTNEIIYNERWAEILGYTLSELQPISPDTRSKLTHPDDEKESNKRIQACFDKQCDFYECECRMKHKNGHWIWVLDRGKVLSWTTDGLPLMMYGTHTDITEIKNANSELANINQQLLNSNTELERFAYVASHDLQEPLRMVSSFMNLLEAKYSDIIDEKGKKYIYYAKNGADRMKIMISDLLEYSKAGILDEAIEDINLNDLLAEVTTLFAKDLLDKKGQILIGQMPVIKSCRMPLHRIFQNIISNALKYQKLGQPPIININALIVRNHIEFSINDNGIGIKEENYNKIFTIFQRLHNKKDYSGTGIGLAIVERIIEKLGGKIWVESQFGVGSSFFFTIPTNISTI